MHQTQAPGVSGTPGEPGLVCHANDDAASLVTRHVPRGTLPQTARRPSRAPRPTTSRSTRPPIHPSVHTESARSWTSTPSRSFESGATAVDVLPHRDDPVLADITRSTWNVRLLRQPPHTVPAAPTPDHSSTSHDIRDLVPATCAATTMLHVEHLPHSAAITRPRSTDSQSRRHIIRQYRRSRTLRWRHTVRPRCSTWNP